MRKSLTFLFIILLVISLPGCFNLSDEKEEDGEGLIDQVKKDRAVIACQKECRIKKEIEDYANGPCLSNSVQPDWVCDIAHSPRQEVDDDPANQCSAYRQGTANHFVELDLDCKLIRAQ